MAPGRPIAPIVLDDTEKSQLLSLTNARSLPHGLVRRAQIVLACAEGEPNASIARRMRLTPANLAGNTKMNDAYVIFMACKQQIRNETIILRDLRPKRDSVKGSYRQGGRASQC